MVFVLQYDITEQRLRNRAVSQGSACYVKFLGVLLPAIQCDLKSMPPQPASHVKLYSNLHQNSDVILSLCHRITGLEIKNKNKFSKMCHKRIKSCLLFSVMLLCKITVRDLENKERKKERKKEREREWGGGVCVCVWINGAYMYCYLSQ